MTGQTLNKSIRNTPSFYAALLNTIFLFSLFLLPINNAFADKNLSSLQKQLQDGKKTYQTQTKQQAQLENEIANSEQQIAAASLQLQITKQSLKAESEHLLALKNEIKKLKSNKIKQQKLLEQQLISAYMTGQNDLIKLLLNQEDLSKIIRAKSYYHYLNKARLESIEQLQATQLDIEKNSRDQEQSLIKLQQMRDQQAKNKNKLTNQRNKRNKALQALKKDINYQSARLAQLGDAEKKLKDTLKKQKQKQEREEKARIAAEQKRLASERAQALAAKKAKELAEKEQQAASKKNKSNWIKPKTQERSDAKIAKFKGRLNWPINGKVLAHFNSKRSDQVRWKGISIAANEGEKVRAVATGKVLFAGYFKGYGMVVALDHSDDYITLYGYNQTLLQKTGDIVYQGDAIALAGHSGGQDRNSLYFELSHKGQAQNPLSWLRKRSR